MRKLAIYSKCLAIFIAFALTFSGCTKESTEKSANNASTSQTRAAVKLTVVVLDDPELANALKPLRGEWNERTGGELEILQLSKQEFELNDSTPIDLLIYPSHCLGEFIAQERLRKVNSKILEGEAFGQSDLLPLIRNHVLKYGEETYSLPLGEAPLLCLWQGIKSAEELPTTWQECDEMHILLEVTEGMKHPHAFSFLVRAVGYASHPGRTAILFDPESFQPRINSPPFVRALEDLVAQQQSDNEDSIRCTLATPRELADLDSARDTFLISGIPKTSEVYNYSRKLWEPNKAKSSPTLLGFSGRLVSVARASKNAASAYKLLNWLATGEIATSLSQRSHATVWFRRSQVSQAGRWLSDNVSNSNAVEVITEQLSYERCFLLPRISAIELYLAELDENISRALAGQATAEEALKSAVENWEVITEQQGREQQLRSYRQHLGYSE